MDMTAGNLTSRLLRFSAARPHVFVVTAVGGTAARLAVEAELSRRGWPAAGNPADADLLVIAGAPGPRLADVLDALWHQIPEPKARVEVAAPDTAPLALTRAAAALADPWRSTPALSAARAAAPLPPSAGRAGHHAGADDGASRGHAHPGHDEGRGESAAGDPPHGDPIQRDPIPGEPGPGDLADEAGPDGGEHGHGGGMEMPGGLPMADLGSDRDGLTLDQLHVALGPALPDWPAGLLVHVVLQGDVVQAAQAEVLDPHPVPPFWYGAHPAAKELDSMGRLLAVAGWDDAAARSRRLRDELLSGTSPDRVAAPAQALLRRVRRSRTLRWLVGDVPAGAGDVRAILEQRMDAVIAALTAPDASPRPAYADLAELGSLLVGAEFAALRLIVAALDPDTDTVDPTEPVSADLGTRGNDTPHSSHGDSPRMRHG